MAEKTYIVKLAGDSKSYQSATEQARRSLDNFQKQNLSTSAAVKSLTSVLGQYISAAALIKGAQEAINRTIKGSQTTADAYAATMHAAKVSVDNFFSSLSTGDFSSFTLGLQTITQQAKEAYMALDRLGNASMSWNYFQTARMADLTDYQAIVRNKDLPMAERQAAAQNMAGLQSELQGYADEYEKKALEAMAKKLTEATAVKWENVDRSSLEKILRLSLVDTNTSNAMTDALSASYKEYQTKLKQIAPVAYSSYTLNGSVIKNYDPKDQERYNAEVRALAASYQDAILYNEALVRHSDEWLQELIQIVQQADNAARSMRRVNSAVQEANNSLNITPATTASGGAPVFNSSLPPMAGLMGDSGMSVPTTLPEINTDLQNINSSLEKMGGNVRVVSGGFQNMASASDGINSLGRSVEQIGSAFSSFGNSGIGNTLGAIGAAIQAYSQLAASAATAAAAQGALETPTVWGKLAAISSLVVAFTSMASQMKSLSSYAEGGIIPGQNYNDGITARVSSGEMIINEADQKRLYDSIHSGSVGGGGGSASITGEQIVIAVNNYGRRTNRGELVFAGRG